MDQYKHQGELFNSKNLYTPTSKNNQELLLNRKTIEDWQGKIYSFQSIHFNGESLPEKQVSIFENPSNSIFSDEFNPLSLTPLPIIFWKWPTGPHQGPAVYFVLDQFNNKKDNIVLYIGETLAADQRWKGDHDCKAYLENYCECLQKANMKFLLNIRFWIDVPEKTKTRRDLEQKLIKKWRPPFNKETRSRWSTPFTSHLL